MKNIFVTIGYMFLYCSVCTFGCEDVIWTNDDECIDREVWCEENSVYICENNGNGTKSRVEWQNCSEYNMECVEWERIIWNNSYLTAADCMIPDTTCPEEEFPPDWPDCPRFCVENNVATCYDDDGVNENNYPFCKKLDFPILVMSCDIEEHCAEIDGSVDCEELPEE